MRPQVSFLISLNLSKFTFLPIPSFFSTFNHSNKIVHHNPGAVIHACKASGRHVVALEPDTEIFEALLKPVQELPNAAAMVNIPSSTEGDSASDTEDLIVVPLQSRFCT